MKTSVMTLGMVVDELADALRDDTNVQAIGMKQAADVLVIYLNQNHPSNSTPYPNRFKGYDVEVIVLGQMSPAADSTPRLREYILSVAEYHRQNYKVDAISLREAVKKFEAGESETLDDALEYVSVDDTRGYNGIIEAETVVDEQVVHYFTDDIRKVMT